METMDVYLKLGDIFGDAGTVRVLKASVLASHKVHGQYITRQLGVTK